MVAISGSSSLPSLAQRREDRGVDQPAERGTDHQRDANAHEIVAAEGDGEEIGGKSPEVTMSACAKLIWTRTP